MISIIAYHVHDLMTEKVKEFKKELSQSMSESAEQLSQSSSSSHKFTESKINLLRYGGFALHSMLLKRVRGVTEINKVDIEKEVELLLSIRVTEKEWDELPPAIQYLQQGGLDIISPRMLPFLRYVVEKTTSLVNDERARQYGRDMIGLAQREINADATAMSLFNEETPTTFTIDCKTRVCTELTCKIFHARVNEYMSATQEVQLEKEGKVVKAEQSLRDSLKTLSALKSRK